MPHTPPLHPSIHRKPVSSLSPQQQAKLRQLIDTYIATQNPVAEHLAAGNNPMLDIHMMGFLAWHNVFLGKLENWLVMNNGQEFVPLPYYDPATPIPAPLNKNNTNPNFPIPDSLRPGAIANIPDYMALNKLAADYHNKAHGKFGGQMPNPQTSPADPIFWPFHAFLVAVYEHWRSH